jgi:hypothetical protein
MLAVKQAGVITTPMSRKPGYHQTEGEEKGRSHIPYTWGEIERIYPKGLANSRVAAIGLAESDAAFTKVRS